VSVIATLLDVCMWLPLNYKSYQEQFIVYVFI